MGANKALISMGEGPLLERAAQGALDAGATSVGVIAPEDVFSGLFPCPPPGIWRTLENPPHGGPVAGIAAGFEALSARSEPERGPDFVAVVACDLPGAPDALSALVGQAKRFGNVASVDGFLGLDAQGWRQPLLALYSSSYLETVLAELLVTRAQGVRNVAARRLLDGGKFVNLPLSERLTQDVDTVEDIDRYKLLTEGNFDS